MRYGVLAVVLIGAATLGGCTEGVLDPKGPIAAAERQILFNSLGIMLAIVIPTILATLGVAYWFRSSNTRARYLPDFDYSGRLELLVWSIPAMTVLLVGGVAWVGAHDLDPRKPITSTVEARHRSGRLARLEMAVHLSRARHRERQSSDHPGRHADQLRADLLGRDEQLLRAAAGQPDLHHGGNGHAPSPAGRPSWNVSGALGPVQRRRLCRHALYRRCGAGREVCAVGDCNAQRWSGARRANLCRSGQAEQSGCAFHLSCRRSQSVQRHRELRIAAGRFIAAHLFRASQRAEK